MKLLCRKIKKKSVIILYPRNYRIRFKFEKLVYLLFTEFCTSFLVLENMAYSLQILAVYRYLEIRLTSHKKSKKMQQCINFFFQIYMNMFRVTHRPSSGA